MRKWSTNVVVCTSPGEETYSSWQRPLRSDECIKWLMRRRHRSHQLTQWQRQPPLPWTTHAHCGAPLLTYERTFTSPKWRRRTAKAGFNSLMYKNMKGTPRILRAETIKRLKTQGQFQHTSARILAYGTHVRRLWQRRCSNCRTMKHL